MKLLPIFLFSILLSFTSIAQDSKFEIGIQAGPNLTNIRYSSDIVQSNRHPQIAGIAGVFVQYNINKTFSLRTDPAFERLADKSGEVTFTDQSGNITGTGKNHFRYDYFSISLLVRASIGNKAKFFINAGPSLGLLFNQSGIYDWPNNRHKTNDTKYYQTLNFGLTAGVGVALPIKEKFSLSFEIRNNLGLTNINAIINSTNEIKTNATSLLIGFAYKFGAKK